MVCGREERAACFLRRLLSHAHTHSLPHTHPPDKPPGFEGVTPSPGAAAPAAADGAASLADRIGAVNVSLFCSFGRGGRGRGTHAHAHTACVGAWMGA